MVEENKISEFKLLLDKYIKSDKINHAYLIETNYNDRREIAKVLIEKILSFEENKKIEDLEKNSDIQFIKTDLQTIKKEEIINLKDKFKTKSIYNSKRIYVIEEAEKLNNSSANTLLKFLEEPNDDIIAILITINRNIVINTVISRCQIIRFYVPEIINNEYNKDYINKVFDFVITIEKKKEKAIAYANNIYTKEILDRTSLAEFLKNILYIYSDTLYFINNVELNYFYNYKDKIAEIAKFNDVKTIKNKIITINMCLERIKYNPNIKLLLDKLIISMSGVDLDE